MREIKFRALKDDMSNCKFIYGSLVYKNLEPYIIHGFNEHGNILMNSCLKDTEGQFTGLYDKNGKDIYEGDIIALDDMICPITWGDGSFQMITSVNQGKSALIQDRAKKWVVIGNIYENPDLLD